jgi:co-chaperonin GroES (HSP10)
MIKATNNFVFIIRDETETEVSGMLIPGKGQEKPHWGTAYSVGPIVKDKSIKKDKKCLFFMIYKL